jgi:hypothetical protein
LFVNDVSVVAYTEVRRRQALRSSVVTAMELTASQKTAAIVQEEQPLMTETENV